MRSSPSSSSFRRVKRKKRGRERGKLVGRSVGLGRTANGDVRYTVKGKRGGRNADKQLLFLSKGGLGLCSCLLVGEGRAPSASATPVRNCFYRLSLFPLFSFPSLFLFRLFGGIVVRGKRGERSEAAAAECAGGME